MKKWKGPAPLADKKTMTNLSLYIKGLVKY